MKKSICAVAIVAGGASMALADPWPVGGTIDLSGFAGDHGRNDVRISTNGGASDRGVWAGQIKQNTSYSQWPTIYTFCTELAQTTGAGTFDIRNLEDAPDPGTPMGGYKAAAITRMYVYAESQGFNVFGRVKTSDANGHFAAALQIAIWEVLSDLNATGDGGLGAGGGTFQLTASSTATDNWVDTLLVEALNTGNVLDPQKHMIAFTNDGRQDQIYFTVIPLPTSAGLAAVGLSGVLLAGRRRFR